jgi:energy-coupling factor transporter ATP-binding protein EcfA2
MKWDELPHGRELQVRVRRADPNAHVVGPCFLSADGSGVSIETERGHFAAMIVAGAPELRDLLDAPAKLVVAEEAERGTTILVGKRFAGEVTVGDTLHVALPPEVEETLPVGRRGRLAEWLVDEFQLDGRYFAWIGGRDSGRPLAVEPFELLGRRMALAVEVKNGRHVATRLRKKGRARAQALILRATIELVPAKDLVSTTALAEVENAAKEGSSWFGVWQEYQRAEQEVLADLARRLGRVAYRSFELTDNARKVIFHLPAAPGQDWFEEEQPFDVAVLSADGKELAVGLRLAVSRDRILCEADNLDGVPTEGELLLATAGDTRRLQRRDDALRKMQAGETQMPDLADVLDGRGRTARVGATLRTLTGSTLRSLGGRDLTPAQLDAVDIALNTPDIALIQGPPGTGKTTVIRVITQRLHEEGRSPVLLTAYQHQAVLRVLDGVETGGVPAIRIGGARGEDPSEGLRPVQAWIEDRRAAARRALDGLPDATPATARAEELWRLARAWRRRPGGRPGAQALLRELRSMLGAAPPAELIERLDDGERALVAKPTAALEAPTRERLASALKQQLTGELAWKDCGPANARKLGRALRQNQEALQAVGRWPTSRTLAIIERAEQLAPFTAAPPGFLAELGVALDELAILFAPAPPRPPDQVPAEIDAVLNAILAWADGEAARTGPGLADALRRFEQRLVDDPTVVPEVLRQYANAVGATVSQAVGRDMRELHDQFDTVIVDEAARANPLDMLVALAIGRRIILVGDQEQLPHMLEPRLEAAVNGGRALDASAVLRQSLFSRLWELYATSPPGGIPRVQRLQDQFRMHPVIGQLISDTFYGGSLRSRTDAAALANDTGLFDGKPLAFVHVGGAAETGRYLRRREAEKLADRVDALLESLGGADWTVGVISFYAQQVGLLRQLGEERGWPARVSIGTVDAFQGREFDAVFLSCVRARGEVGFLAMPNRLNVAMSRARRLLVAFGHAPTVRQVEALNKLWERVSREGCHDSV